METRLLLSFLSFFLLFIDTAMASMSGFVSLDCGGKENFTDDIGLEWTPDDQLMYGETANISVANETRKQYMTVRHFPVDNRKYCYRLDVITRTRYLVRATFLYGNFDNNNVYPKFDIYLDTTHWSTIVISDANAIEFRELIVLASYPTLSVCLSNATTGNPFISTIELRQFNGSIYYTEYENQFFLSVSARINFGADSDAPVRYPDDPYDRIWESDSVKKENYLVDVAAGTEKVSTRMPIYVFREMPPEKVLQTAVVGRNGSLTYRLYLDGFPGYGWAYCYLAEIENLSPNETRKFRILIPDHPATSKIIVNIQENANGKNRLYEAGYPNISFPFVFSFQIEKTPDSSLGPLFNSFEISKYVKKNDGSLDGTVIANLVSHYPSADWAQEGGDPCLPVPWSWVQCNSDPQPRIVSIFLSGKNLTGNIPSEMTKLTGLIEIHLENNRLTGEVPPSLMDLQNLRKLYLQNNMLSGTIPWGLLNKNLVLNYSGNANLHKGGRGDRGGSRMKIIIGSSVGVAVLLIIVSYLFLHKGKKRFYEEDQPASVLPDQRLVSSLLDATTESAHCFTLSEIDDATKNFEKKIGSGGFGVVYYGKMKDGKEIAVKVLTTNSYQGEREFSNEVALLSRIHHRNLVQFLGYCQEEGKNILVFELMHNGTLKEYLYGPLTREQSISWIKRLEIAEDAAKGIEYLHTGCAPKIIHRDLKSSNILLDKHMRAKVSDFGSSKLAVDGATHVSTIVQGTVGYLDPEYYISQQLTDKSDVYGFGVILVELISGQEAISNESFGVDCCYIVQWAKLHIENGDIQRIIDPSLRHEFDIQSVWKIAEKSLMCVQPRGNMRPSISEVLKEIQDAISIERRWETAREVSLGDMSSSSILSPTKMGSLDLRGTEPYKSFDSIMWPAAR